MEEFGYQLIVDLARCNHFIRSEEKIKEFNREFLKVIDMKPYGEPIIHHFGHNSEKASGFTLVQLVETSDVTIHFSEFLDAAFIDVFSCKEYDQGKAVKFIKDFFGGEPVRILPLIRGIPKEMTPYGKQDKKDNR